MAIKAIDTASIHRITSGQVVIDLQTAVKELLENSVDAGATNVEVRFKNYGLASIEVLDNGCGIQEADHESIALKHHTSKLETYSELASMRTFGFRGEALSSLCALCEEVVVTTATLATAPMGVTLTMDGNGQVHKKGTVARNQGTTITLKNLFKPLPVRRKEFERNAKREYGKALTLLNAYALGPCAAAPGIRLTVSNQPDKGAKSLPIKTVGTPSCRASTTALWGSKALDNIIDMDIAFEVEREKTSLKALQSSQRQPISVQVKGLISKFSVGCGRAANDRQFFYVNGRPCNMPKVQKAFNEAYRSFNATQAPFIIADFVIPTESYDVNVSPDKRTILLHSEGNLVSALKAALESHFVPSRATYDVGDTQARSTTTQTLLTQGHVSISARIAANKRKPAVVPDDNEDNNAHSTDEPTSQNTTFPKPSTKSSTPPLFLPSPSPHQSDNETAPSIPQHKHGPSDQPDNSVDVDSSYDTASEDLVLDTSQTAWAQRLGRRSSSPLPLSPGASVPPAPPTLAPSHSQDEWSDEERADDLAHMRKKRKLDVVAVTARVVDNQGTPASPPTDAVAALRRRESCGGPSSASTRSTKSVDPGERSTLAARDRAKGVSIKTHMNSQGPSRTFRAQLADFARSGSQITGSQMRVDVLEDEDSDVEEGAQGDPMDEVADGREIGREDADVEEDELDGSDHEEEALVDNHSNLSDRHNTEPEVLISPAKPSSSTFASSSSGAQHASAIDLTNEDEDDLDDPTSILNQARASSSTTPSHKDTVIRHPEIIRSETADGDITLRFEAGRVRKVWALKSSSGQSNANTRSEQTIPESVLEDAGLLNTDNDQRAVDALARVIEKTDFAAMDVVGQFNLGFIVVRRRKADSLADYDTEMSSNDRIVLDDLFIVDQHAADEKYNFETLQATTKIQSQKLFRPRPLELTASDEMLAIENMKMLQQNGFEIDLDEESSVGQGGRLRLISQPVSKSTVFDMKDLEEIIHLMRDLPIGQIPRCSKARAMFASRACRKSVMVGMPLNHHQMTTVIRHMGTMDQPWNCPHGRPTMRHLLDICHSGARPREGVDWSSFQ